MKKIFTDKISTKVFFIILGIGLISLLPMFFLMKSKDYINILYAAILVLGLNGLLGLLKIKFQFLETSLQYSFSPFVNNKIIFFSEINEIKIEKAFFLKYGGLGIRIISNGIAYILGNEKNLCIHLKNGKNIVLSFRAADEEEIINLLQNNNIAVS
jgi:hypothetical protein